MANVLNPTWDLDVFFTGGSDSPELVAHLDELERRSRELHGRIEALTTDVDAWATAVADFEVVYSMLVQAAAYISCLMAQNVEDRQALVLHGRVRTIAANVEALGTLLDEKLKALSEGEFATIVNDPRIESAAFSLTEHRRRASERMDTARELLANDLAVDGYHALQTLYNTVVGRIKIPFAGEELSVGQAANRFSNPDRTSRQALFVAWEEAWAKEADLASHALNHLSGFRLNLYKQRGWDDFLKEPLENNRLSRAALDAMWAAVESSKSKLTLYLARKAKLLGADRLAWYDMDAPVSESTQKISFDDSAHFITEQFRKFSPRLADFTEKAFRERWIEAEDRPKKRPGGFCTTFPLSSQSRIFMTFSGTPGGQSTLAHELGHAYHAEVMSDLRPFARSYPMNLAETASTFAELIVSSAAIEQAKGRDERIALLGKRLDDAVAYLMNIHARFIFETRFYERRAKGLLSVEEINALMETAQREAFADSLEAYHPLFWASKLHFYITSQPFYNFPYTFGYLFSAAIYARALAEGPAFEHKYVELLRDTGRMSVEDLARKHLGADITDVAFWQQGLTVAYNDLDQFLAITE